MKHICVEVLTERGMLVDGKPVFKKIVDNEIKDPSPKILKWADVTDDE